MSQTRSTNPFRPGSGILPPLLAGREHETATFKGRIERTRHGQPEHTALLGDWAIGKTTLLMHWRRLLRHAGDAVVLTMAYPLTPDQFLSSLVVAIEAELATDWSGRLDLEVGLDLGVADARLRRPARSRDQELRATMRRLVDQRGGHDRAVVVFVDDIDLVSGPGDVLLQLRASALELYAGDVAFAFAVAASPSLFAEVRSAHEPLVRFFQPLSLGPLDAPAADRAVTGPLAETPVRFDAEVVGQIVELSGGRPYYLQKLAYHAFDAAESGLVSQAEFAVAFERPLIADTVEKEGIAPGQLTIHADRGTSMRSKPVALLLADLGVERTHSRPHVSNDCDPFSESQFRTLKYRPTFPARFGSIEDARAFCADFFTWYNTQHRHSGIGLLTPAEVHAGRAPEMTAARALTLDAAYAAHPERFVRRPPTPPEVPTAVWINPPARQEVPTQ